MLGGENSPVAFIASVDQPFIEAERSLPFSAVVRHVAAGLQLLPNGHFPAFITYLLFSVVWYLTIPQMRDSPTCDPLEP
jgi:hypothetical protein